MQAKAPAERDVEALLCGFETTSNRSWPNESWIIHVNNASVNSKHQHPPPPGLTPREFFKVVKFPALRQKIFAKLRPRGKKIDNPRPWGQCCGPSRQFCHDRGTIRIFLALFFSLAFLEFFQRL